MKKFLVALLMSLLLLIGCAKAASQTSTSPEPEATERAEPATVQVETTEPAQDSSPEASANSETSAAGSLIAQAQAYLESGETEEKLNAALKAYQSALEIEENNHEAILGIADIYIRQGDFEGALAFLKEYTAEETDEAIQEKVAELETGNVNDLSGKIRKATGDGKNGNAPYVHLYDYDGQGRLCRVTWYDGDGNERDHVDVTYDEQGKILTRADMVLSSSLAGSLIHSEFVYDDQGRNITVKRTLPGQWSEEIRYYYDEEGHITAWETYSNERLELTDVLRILMNTGKRISGAPISDRTNCGSII